MRGNIGVGEAEEVCLIKYQTNETGLFFCLNFSFVRQHNPFLCLNQVPSILGFFFPLVGQVVIFWFHFWFCQFHFVMGIDNGEHCNYVEL
jgi:hypothetical protein